MTFLSRAFPTVDGIPQFDDKRTLGPFGSGVGERKFLQVAFDSMIVRHGSIDVYLAEVVGVTATMKEALVKRLVIGDETGATGSA
jgi:hypothetical protein